MEFDFRVYTSLLDFICYFCWFLNRDLAGSPTFHITLNIIQPNNTDLLNSNYLSIPRVPFLINPFQYIYKFPLHKYFHIIGRRLSFSEYKVWNCIYINITDGIINTLWLYKGAEGSEESTLLSSFIGGISQWLSN